MFGLNPSFAQVGHVFGGGGLEFCFHVCSDSGVDGVLKVGVESFLWVQFRAVAGQAEQFDLLLVFLHPDFPWLGRVLN